MVERRPLVTVGGSVQELPTGDTTALGTKVTRQATLCGGGIGPTYPSPVTFTEQGMRIPIMFPVRVKKIRIGVRNYDTLNQASKTAGTLKGLKIGRHNILTSGSGTSYTGNFVGSSATTLLSSDQSFVATGAVSKSPWYDVDLLPGIEYLLAGGVVMSASSSVQYGLGLSYTWSTSAAALDPTNTSGTYTVGIPLDWQIEYQADTTALSCLWVGDSLSEGLTGTQGTQASPNFVPMPWHTNAPHRWGRRRGVMVQNISLLGLTLVNAGSLTDWWSRTDLDTPAFDMGVVALGSNDAFSTRTLAQMQGDLSTVVARVRTKLVTDAPLWLVNVPPRGSTGNSNRLAYNKWMAAMPYGAAGIIDYDAALKQVSGDATSLPTDFTTDATHPSHAGTEIMANRIRSTIGPT